MIFYLSGYDAIPKGPVQDWAIKQCTSRLQSCHEVHIKSTDHWLSRSAELGICGGVDLMLDSGAFTAWNKGYHLTLDDLLPIYSRLQEDYHHLFKSIVYINLDTIPGSRQKVATPEEVDQALEESDRNYEILERELGKCILPVYHQGEPWERLREVATQSNFICISARQGLSENIRINFIHQVVNHMAEYGLKNDLHGLATTGNNIIRAADWFSVDSATWAIAAAFGSILIEINNNIYPITVSDQSPKRHTRDSHFDTMNKQHKEVVIESLGKYKLTPEMVSREHGLRRAFNMVSLRDWALKLGLEEREIRREQSLFDYF